MKGCKEYYEYVLEELERTDIDNISIHGKMPEKCIDYFKKRGISVEYEPMGYIHFKRVIE